MDQCVRELASTCLDWIYNPKRQTHKLPRPEGPLCSKEDLELGNDSTLQLRTQDTDSGTYWGMRFQHPDSDDPDLIWATEITLHPAENNSIHFACSVFLGRSEFSYSPVKRFVTRPKIVATVLEKFQSDSIFPVSTKAFSCPDDPALVSKFVEFLESPSRRLPVVVISAAEDGGYFTDASSVASKLAGLAHVIAFDNDHVAEVFTTHFADSLSVFAGGIRIYWPGFSRVSNRFDHPLFTRQSLQRINARHPKAISNLLLSRIAEVAAFSVGDSFLSWHGLLSIIRKSEMSRAREDEDWQTLAEQYADENDALELELTTSREALERQSRETNEARQQADHWKNTYLALAAGEDGIQDETKQSAIASVADALDTANAEFSDTLVFAPNSKSDPDTPFSNPTEVYGALRWLATRYRDARSGKTPCPDLDMDLRGTIESWTWSGGQSSVTTGEHKAWYQAVHNGKKHEIGEHIGTGSSKDARHTIRIGF